MGDKQYKEFFEYLNTFIQLVKSTRINNAQAACEQLDIHLYGGAGAD